MSNPELTIASALTKTVVRIAGIIQHMIDFVLKFVGICHLTCKNFIETLFPFILRLLFQNQDKIGEMDVNHN